LEDKLYQVFISSTYEDLKDERAAVEQVLIACNCLPIGMERFLSLIDLPDEKQDLIYVLALSETERKEALKLVRYLRSNHYLLNLVYQ